MNRNMLVLPASFLTLTIAATFVSSAAAKEATDKAAMPTEEITVEAPRIVRHEVSRTAVGGQVEEIDLTRHVSYADLDLKRDADVTQLGKRVDDVAREACDQLARIYPAPEDATEVCVHNAVHGARPEIDAAVAAAKR